MSTRQRRADRIAALVTALELKLIRTKAPSSVKQSDAGAQISYVIRYHLVKYGISRRNSVD